MTSPPQSEVTRPRSYLGQTEVVALVVLAVLLGGRWLVPLLDHPSLATWSTIFVAIVIQSTPFLVIGVILSAVISALLSEKVLDRVVPKNPALGVPVAGVAGIGLPGCECAAVPIAGSLIRRGIAPAVALTFLLAAPAINPAVMVSTAVAFPGQPSMVVARFVASLLTAVLVGWWVLSRGARLPITKRLEAFGEDMSKREKFVETVRHDFLHAAGFLVIGAILAAGINTFVPRSIVETVAGQAVLGVLTLALFAFLVALCSESDAFVAASFTAFSDTAKLVFLVVGPAMDVKLAAMEAGTFGGPFARQFVPVVVATAILSAVGVGWWLL
ncbi:permease [Nocardioides dongxiaopingii]|uniref:permease n=1 Tax=Nocardioides sp. S-1144 TaxID=2582905 RepID=UPI00110F030C|nr:permease [Nocardioides sp. S-1144]QCW49790.1 permease [Nocardioides sp. S-1144]